MCDRYVWNINVDPFSPEIILFIWEIVIKIYPTHSGTYVMARLEEERHDIWHSVASRSKEVRHCDGNFCVRHFEAARINMDDIYCFTRWSELKFLNYFLVFKNLDIKVFCL